MERTLKGGPLFSFAIFWFYYRTALFHETFSLLRKLLYFQNPRKKRMARISRLSGRCWGKKAVPVRRRAQPYRFGDGWLNEGKIRWRRFCLPSFFSYRPALFREAIPFSFLFPLKPPHFQYPRKGANAAGQLVVWKMRAPEKQPLYKPAAPPKTGHGIIRRASDRRAMPPIKALAQFNAA